MIGLCPFHNEKTPSFTVSPTKNIFKCFGCGKGGGPVQFLMEHDQLSFPEAIRFLAARYNVALEEDSKEETEQYAEQKKEQESYHLVNDFARDFYVDQLMNTEEGRRIGLSYFEERGFLKSTLEKFQLGFAPKDSKALVKAAIAKQYKEEYLQTLGLMSKKGYDFFRDRVMFTIHNVSGKVIAFAGRTLSSDKKQPKYVNSPESPIYNKRKVLYGLHLAKGPIRKKDNCLIVEGYTDVISLVQNGVDNVVASSGTALTSEQVRLVKRYTDKITFLYDGDTAGVKAALRGLDIVLENDMNVSLVLLPEGEDPDSFIKKNGNAKFEAFIAENAKDFIFFKMDLLLSESEDDPIKKAAVIKDIIGSIAKLRDPIKRSLYVQQCSQALGVSEAILVKEVNKGIKQEIKLRQLEKQRADRREQREQQAQNKSTTPTHQSDGDFPVEPPPGFDGGAEEGNEYDEWNAYPEEKVKHQQPSFKVVAMHAYQEKDLARIVVTAGDKLIANDEEESEMSIAEFVYTEIFDIIEYFENKKYQKIITDGFNYMDGGQKQGISNYFVNHSDQEIAKLAVDTMSSPYEFAKWNDIGVYLNQKMPEKNFKIDSWNSILMFKFRKLTIILEKLTARIASEEDVEKKGQLLKAFMKLQQQKKELSVDLGVVIPPK